jgi:SpoIID/LytB domain protein
MRLYSLIASLMLFSLICSCSNTQKVDTFQAFDQEPTVRVLIIYTLDEINFTPTGSYMIKDLTSGSDLANLSERTQAIMKLEDGQIAVYQKEEKITSGKELTLVPSEGAEILIEKVPYGIGWSWANTQDRPYQGPLEVRINEEGHLQIINILPMEEYLCGVVPAEIGTASPMEALKAQAIAARSETVVALTTGKYAGPNYDICPDVECQAYSGNVKRNALTDQAVNETRGEIMIYEGQPVGAYYASNCGGWSEDVQNVWPERSDAVPYWSGNVDSMEPLKDDLTKEKNVKAWIEGSPNVCCNPEAYPNIPKWTHKNFRWVVETTAEELSELVAKKKDIGRVIAIKPGERGPSGRMLKATFVGETGEYTTGPELAIRKMWDPPIKSSCFFVETEGPAEKPEKFIIKGAGWGHGVGMCQTGAISRALEGQSYRDIIPHYYRETTITTCYPVE